MAPGWSDRAPAEWGELLARSTAPRVGIHVTDLIGCPRRKRGGEEGWPADLSKLEARMFGTILHGAMSTIRPLRAEVPVRFPLGGAEIVGSADRLEESDNGFLTCDYKTSEESSWGKLPEAPYDTQVFQQESYRFGLDYMGQYTAGWRIYYRKGGKWACFEHIGALWTESALLAFRPSGSAFSVADNLAMLVSGAKAPALPLVGATQKIGKGTACEWCELREPCDAAGYEVEL